MVAAWPAGVPVCWIGGSYSEKPEQNRAEFQPEVGPPKLRRRSSVKTVVVGFLLKLTSAEFDALLDFYTDDLEDGSLSFTRVHPRTNATETFTFAAIPEIVGLVTNKARVSVSLRKMP